MGPTWEWVAGLGVGCGGGDREEVGRWRREKRENEKGGRRFLGRGKLVLTLERKKLCRDKDGVRMDGQDAAVRVDWTARILCLRQLPVWVVRWCARGRERPTKRRDPTGVMFSF